MILETGEATCPQTASFGIYLDDLVSRKFALRDVNDGCAALRDGSLNRVVVTSFE